MPKIVSQRSCLYMLCFFLLFSSVQSFAKKAKIPDDPCAGPNALLAIMNGPTAANSVCVAPKNQTLLEMGYFGAKLITAEQGHIFPNPTIRRGVLDNDELFIVPPNYVIQSSPSQTGFIATSIGWKHFLGFTEHWAASWEGIFTPPSGDANFGSAGTQATLNGILEYTLDTVSLTAMLGITTQTQPRNSGGGRSNSFNPDFVITWLPKNSKCQFFAEFYGQTKTAPGQGAGFNVDGGIQYQVKPYFLVDVEYGQRLVGVLGNFNQYVGAGLGIMF